MKMDTEEGLERLNPSIISKLLEQHKRFLSFLAGHVSNEQAAKEILQQGMLKAVENSVSLKESDNLIPWFYRILRNLLVDYYRANASEAKKNEAFAAELMASEKNLVAPVDELGSAVCKCLDGLLPTLQPAYAELLRKVDFEGRGIDEVSHELGLTPNSLSVKLHRARKALRKSLERTCGACTKHACLDCSCK